MVPMEWVSTYPILHSMLLGLPILTPTYCSLFYITIAFLLLTWGITIFAGRRDNGKATARNLIDSERTAAIEACKEQRDLELKEHTLRLLRNDLPKLPNDAAIPNKGADQYEVIAHVRAKLGIWRQKLNGIKLNRSTNAW